MKNSINTTPQRWLASVLLALFSLTAAGCATIEGAGKDIETAGEEIQEAADNE
jgi:entericidin B